MFPLCCTPLLFLEYRAKHKKVVSKLVHRYANHVSKHSYGAVPTLDADQVCRNMLKKPQKLSIHLVPMFSTRLSHSLSAY